jgi:PAS domain S-box-containing protein
LRIEAEAKIARDPINLVNPQPGEELLHKLLHELQVHQVELQMQNDELRLAQIAMEESRDRYADLYDFAPIGYLTLSREGMIAEINLTASDMLGVVRKKLLTRRFAQFVAEADRDRWYAHFASVLENEQRQHCVLAFQGEDGSHFTARLDSMRAGVLPGSLDPVQSAAAPAECGNAFVVRIALTDITEQIQAETAMQQAREFAESIVDSVREPLIVLDAAMRVTSASRSFYEAFRVTPEETVGYPLFELGNRQWDIPKLKQLLQEILPHDNVLEGFEVEHEFPLIGRRKMLLNARRILGKVGGTQSILLAIEDVTGRG